MPNIEGQKKLLPEVFKPKKFEGSVEVLEVLPGIVAIRALDIKVVFKPVINEKGKIAGAEEYQDKEKIGSRSTRKADIWIPDDMYRHIRNIATSIFKEQKKAAERARIRAKKEQVAQQLRQKQSDLL